MEQLRVDRWGSGNEYNAYVGRWSRLIADEFLRWLDVNHESHWLDVGCGTGTLVRAILNTQHPRSVHGIDSSSGFIDYASAHFLAPRARFSVGDATALPARDAAFDATVSGLLLNFVPDAGAAVREMARVTRGDGTVAAYVWDYGGNMQMMTAFWNAAVELDPSIQALNEAMRFPIARPEPLRSLFESSGIVDVETDGIEINTNFRDFDDYWSPFLGGQGSAPTYAMSLSDGDRNRLRDRIRASLPIEPDGSISLTARAWVVKGRVQP